MSALARYFHARGYRVYGYDRTPSPLTDQLQKEGLSIFFEDQPERLAAYDLSPLQTLVVRTPAVRRIAWYIPICVSRAMISASEAKCSAS